MVQHGHTLDSTVNVEFVVTLRTENGSISDWNSESDLADAGVVSRRRLQTVLVGATVARMAHRVTKQSAIDGRVATSTPSFGSSAYLAVGTEQRQELATEPAPEEVVRNDVNR